MDDLKKIMSDYRLTTAEILYHMPDHPSLLQTFLWQEYDLCPDFPELMNFLNFWEKKLDGKLHSVKVSNCELITPQEFNYTDFNLTLH